MFSEAEIRAIPSWFHFLKQNGDITESVNQHRSTASFELSRFNSNKISIFKISKKLFRSSREVSTTSWSIRK